MITATLSRWVVASLRLAFACLFLASFTACSSFNSEWSRLAELESKPAPTARTGIEGRWEGKWTSKTSDHEGALRCIVTVAEVPPSSPKNDGAYLFSFSATWGPGIVSDYEITMLTRKDDDRITFEGEMDLGLLGGVYRSVGFIKGDQFSATYESKGDNGTFEMTRPKK